MTHRKLRAIALSAVLALPAVAAAQLVGVVVGVPDGDTLVVRIDTHVISVHLKEIDAPEVGQPFGKRAQQSLAELCDGKSVTLDDLGIDLARRIRGEAECDGVDAGEEQVRRGLAWAAVRPPSSSNLPALQAWARAERRGLWSEPAPVPPWDWSAAFTQ